MFVNQDGATSGDGVLPGDLLSLAVHDHDEAVVVTVAGEIDISTAAQLRAAVYDAADRLDGRRLIVDLSSVSFLGSAGLAVLASVAEAQPAPPVVVGVGRVDRVIRLSGLDDLVDVVDRVEAAFTG